MSWNENIFYKERICADLELRETKMSHIFYGYRHIPLEFSV